MSRLQVGDWIEVLSKEEILGTLDARGQLDGLPFMPQMFSYCGKRFRIYKRAHKTCDTVNQTGGRWLRGGIHLDLRCDGKAYGGCHAGCLLFWKDEWLRKVDGPTGLSPKADHHTAGSGSGCTEAAVWAGTRALASDDQDPTYVCQATQVPAATKLLKWWDVRQYM